MLYFVCMHYFIHIIFTYIIKHSNKILIFCGNIVQLSVVYVILKDYNVLWFHIY